LLKVYSILLFICKEHIVKKNYWLLAYKDMKMMAVFVFNLKKYRKKRNLSQMKLAEMLDTSTSYIGEIEINRKTPSMEMVEKIANALDVEPFRLFIDDESRNGNASPMNTDYLDSLSAIERQDLAKRIISLVSSDIAQILRPENKKHKEESME
jgi:transcriptional regulator with XRE-family HTH domain